MIEVQKKQTILVVDDTPENIDLLTEVLDPHYQTKIATNGEKALKIAFSSTPPDLILLDIMMPGISGYDVCKSLKENLNTHGIPVIFVTAMSDAADEKKGLDMGAVDYITKPINPAIVLTRVRTHLAMHNQARQLKEWNLLLERRVSDGIATIERNVERLRESEKRLKKQNAVLLALAKSEAIDHGHLKIALQEITQAATEALNIDRASVWLCSEDPPGIVLLNLYEKSKNAHSEGMLLKAQDFPAYFKYLDEERSLAAHDAHTDPSTFEFSEVYLKPLGINSMLDAPIRLGGKMVGVICNEHVGPKRIWSLDDINFAGNLADIVSRAMESTERRKAQDRLQIVLNSFARFVPNQFLGYLKKDNIEEVELGDAVEHEMTVLFTDIRNFTLLSEKMTVEDNFKLLNAYLQRISGAIYEHNGFIDKFIGDAIMALFPDPNEALQSAIEMRKLLSIHNACRAKNNYLPIEVGTGLNTGPLMLGTIGSVSRLNTTVIGDSVNLASRVESLTKVFGAPIIVTHHLFKLLKKPDDFMHREIDSVLVKGKTEPVTLYEVFNADSDELIGQKRMNATPLRRAMREYKTGNFEKAKNCLFECANLAPLDPLPKVYLKRCEHLIANPPAEWTGIMQLNR